MIHKIPKYWKIAKLDDICFPPQYGWTTSSAQKGEVRLLRITDISGKSQINWETVPFAQNLPNYLADFLLEKGDILIARSGNTAGVSFCLDEIPYPTLFASYLIRFKPVIVDSKYLHYFTQTAFYWKQITKNKIGNTIPNVNATKLSNIPIPIPPLAEQKRIVISLEKELNDITQKLNDNQTKLAGLKDFRQSVLEDALAWMENYSQYTIEDIALFIGSGVTPTGGQSNYQLKGVPFIRSQNVLNGRLDISDVAYISEELHSNMSRTHIQDEDVLLNITGSSIGRSAVIPKNFGEANVNQHVCIIRVNQQLILPQLLSLFLNSVYGQEIIKSFQGRGNREGLNYSQIKSISIHVPSNIEEQTKIVRLVEEKLQQAKDLEKIYAAEIEKSAKLRQAILQRAFEGDLSEWQEGDASVEDLLERVKEEKKAYQLIIQEKKKMTTNTTQRISLNKLSLLIEEKLIEIYEDREYSAEELYEITVFFGESNYKLVDDNGKINFEDFANAFGELIRKTKINMDFKEGKIYYQNNLTSL